LQNADFQSIFASSASAVTPSKKKLISLILRFFFAELDSFAGQLRHSG